MAAIFADTARFQRWLDIELLATEAWAALGVVPAGRRRRVPGGRRSVVDDAFVAAVDERERVTDHDVAAFVDVVQQRIGRAGPAGSTTGSRRRTWSTRRCAGRCATPPTC